MPIPKKRKGENNAKFIARCMGDSVMNKDYPDQKQRVAICMQQAKSEVSLLEEADECFCNKEKDV